MRVRVPRLTMALAVVVLVAACGPPDDAAVDEGIDTPEQLSTGAPADDEAADDDEAAGDEATDGTDAAPSDAPVADGMLEVHHLDVGQADATLLRHAEATILIDQGDWQRDDVVPHLRAVGVDHLDVAITTHPHADHVGQFPAVLDAFTVDEVWWSGTTTTTQTFERALDALEAADATYAEPRAGDVTEVGPMLIEFIGPDDDADGDDVHDAGLVLRITYGQVRLLFTGDAESATEQRMVDRHRELLDADVYAVGHHGSATSTTPAFLAAVDPQVAIYSAGSGNGFGHPHAEVVDRLTAHRTALYGTDVHGTVVVTTDGVTIDVTTERDGDPAPGDTRGTDTDDGGEGDGGHDDGDGEAADDGAAASSAGGSCDAGQVDLNGAQADGLERIVHIGPERAEAITAGRPFTSVSSLTRLDGIGPARIDDIVREGIACVR